MVYSLVLNLVRLGLLSSVVFALPSPDIVKGRNEGNGTILGNIEFDYSPNPEYDPDNHYAIVNLFKRGCTLPQGGVCSDGAACCNDPSQDNNGWCCNSGKLCGNGESEIYCMLSTVFTTVTTTSFDIIITTTTQSKTITESPSTTTESSTKIVTVTVSDVATATSVVTVTATRSNAKRAEINSFPDPTSTSPAVKRQSVIIPRETMAPQSPSVHHFGLRDLFARQDVAEAVTSTKTVTVSSTSHTSTRMWMTSFVRDIKTTTVVSTITFTSAIDAKTTVTSTFTLTVDSTETGTSSGGQPTETGLTSTGAAQATQTGVEGVTGYTQSLDNGGLSTGAKAGIGIGVAFIAVIGGLGVAFILYKRRQQNRQGSAKLPSPPPTATPVAPVASSGGDSAAIAITSTDEKPKHAQGFYSPKNAQSNPTSPAPPYQQPYQQSYIHPHPESYEMYTPVAVSPVPSAMTPVPHGTSEMPAHEPLRQPQGHEMAASNNNASGWGYSGNAAEMPGSGPTR